MIANRSAKGRPTGIAGNEISGQRPGFVALTDSPYSADIAIGVETGTSRSWW